MIELNIDKDELIKLTNKLEKMHRSALPLAVKDTLNNAAFDVKQRTMPISARKSFTQRKANFFRATSKVEMASGWDVDNMRSIIGFVGGDTNQAVDNLEQQEQGGSIKSRGFIPTKEARVGRTNKGLVKKKNQFKSLKNIAKMSAAKGKNFGQQLIKTAIFVGRDGLILTSETKGALLRVKSINRKGSGTFVKYEMLYSFRRGRTARVKNTNFMERSALQSGKRLDVFFNLQARRQFNKVLR